MIHSKKTSFAIALSSAFALYSGTVLADHGSLGFGIGTASPIITQGGITLPVGMWAGGVTTQFINFDSVSNEQLLSAKENAVDEAHGDVHTQNTYLQPSLFAAYGITDDLMLGLRVPFVLRSGIRSPGHHDEHGDEHDEEANMINNQGDSNGFGDVSVFGQYRFFHTADNLNNASLTIGLKTPTGATGIKDDQGNTFEAHSQPGSGSWDPSFGLSFTRAMGSFSFDTNVLYTVATTGTQQTDLGDIFDYNFAISYAFGAPVRNGFFSSSNNAPWTAILELNGEWQDFQNTARLTDPNSGGNTVYISPGIRYSGGKNWNTALSIGAPIVTELNGFQTDPEYRITYRFVAVF
jgi:hypothetical protein